MADYECYFRHGALTFKLVMQFDKRYVDNADLKAFAETLGWEFLFMKEKIKGFTVGAIE